MPDKISPDEVDTTQERQDAEEIVALCLSVTDNTVAVESLTVTLEKLARIVQTALLALLTAICLGWSLMLVLS